MKETHYAIIKGFKCRKIYYFRDARYYEPGIYETTENLEVVTIFEGMIENPLLEVDEKVYIAELNATVEVEDRVRNLSGGYIYYTNHTFEVIEDEKTKKSLEKAKAREKTFLELEEKKDKEEIIKNNPYYRDITKKWYEFWK